MILLNRRHNKNIGIPAKRFLTFAAILILQLGNTINAVSQTEFAGTLDGVSITDAQGTNSAPTAVLTYTRDGDTFTFDASGSSDSDGSITEYKWDFGDGITSSDTTTNYQPQSTDSFLVTLTTIDDQGAVTLHQETIGSAVNVGDTTEYADGSLAIRIDHRYGFKLIATPQKNGILKSISALVSSVAGTQAKRLKFSLYTHDTVNDMPGTLIATTAELLSSDVIGERKWVTGQVSGTYQVTLGNQYWVVVEALDKYSSIAKGSYGAASKTRFVDQGLITTYNWDNWGGSSDAVNKNYPFSLYISCE